MHLFGELLARQRRVGTVLFGLALAALSACGADGDEDGAAGRAGSGRGGTTGHGGSSGGAAVGVVAGTGGDEGSPGDVTAGAYIVSSQRCRDCHGQQLSGGGTANPYPRNLTPHATGLAGWTDAQIARAVREGLDAEGNTLCAAMPRFTSVRDGGMRDLVAFLRSLTPVDNKVPDSACQP